MVTVRIPDDLKDRIDTARPSTTSREAWVRAACESALSAAETRELGAHAKLAEAKRDAERKLAKLSATPSAFAKQQALNDAKAKGRKR